MSLRDLAVLLVTYGSLPVAAFVPFAGLLVYSWLAYMRPQDLAWGMAEEHRLSLYVGAATLVGLLLHLRRERLVTWRPQTVMLLLFLGWIAVSQWQAVDPEAGEVTFGLYWKAILVAVVTTGLVRTRERFRLLMLVIAGSLGLLGLKYALFGLVRGGTRFDHGPGGFMNDNNGFAAALAMSVPLLAGVVLTERRPLLRAAGMLLGGASVLALLFTFSRGGFLALAGAVGLLLLRSRRRLMASTVILAGALAFFTVVGSDVRSAYSDRILSIDDYESDRSAMGRIEAWRISYEVFLDNPVFGVGPNNFQVVYPRYSVDDDFRVAHNTYFQLLAESGAPGLGLFVLAIGVTLWRLERLRRGAGDTWVESWAAMLQISLAAYLLGSLTLNRAYFDLLYHLLALSVSLEVAAGATGAVARDADEEPWWRLPQAEAA